MTQQWESDSTPAVVTAHALLHPLHCIPLRPRLPITYNERALSCLNGRPPGQDMQLPVHTLPLSSNDEETESDSPAEDDADSPHTEDKSLTSRPRARLTPMTRDGVTKQPDNARLAPVTRGRITTGTADLRTSMPDRLLCQRAELESSVLNTDDHHTTLDQANQVTTKGALQKEA